MTPTDTSIARRIAITAQRLQQVEADFAEQPVDSRRQYQIDELQRGMALVPEDQRMAFLDELAGQVPGLEYVVQSFALLAAPGGSTGEADSGAALDGDPFAADEAPPAARTTSHTPAASPAVTVSPDSKSAASKSPNSKSAVSKSAALKSAAGNPALDSFDPKSLREALGLVDSDVLSAPRALEMVGPLVKFVCALSQLSWSTWRTIATHSAVRRNVNLEKLLAKFVAGDSSSAIDNVAHELERLRLLTASLIWAISQAGHHFAANHLSKFAVAEIEGAVNSEPAGGWWGSKPREVLYWRKYVELSESLSPLVVESSVRQLIVDHTEQLLKTLAKSEKK